MVQLDEHRDLAAQELRVERLYDIVHRPGRVRADSLLDVFPVGSQEDDRRVARARTRADVARGLHAVEPRHAHIEQDDREFLLQQATQSLLARAHAHDALPERLENGAQRVQRVLVVVDEQHARGVRGHVRDRRRMRDRERDRSLRVVLVHLRAQR